MKFFHLLELHPSTTPPTIQIATAIDYRKREVPPTVGLRGLLRQFRKHVPVVLFDKIERLELAKASRVAKRQLPREVSRIEQRPIVLR